MTKGHVPPIVEPFLEQVRLTIREHGMTVQGARILVGVSGGPDSVALLHAMASLQEEYAMTLGVAHVNHCLRGQESDRDALFVEKLAENLHIPFYVKTTNVAAAQKKSGLSLEETAREVRKDFFASLVQKHAYDRIALGHHADDNAEWILISLIRGAGTGGLSGIPPVNETVVRPLFNLTRKEILRYCQDHNLDWVLDSTNQDQSILRNRVRLHLLPMLEEQYNPSILRGLNRLSRILREEHQWMDGLAREFLDQYLKPLQCGAEIPLKPLGKSPLPIQRRIILLAMAQVRGSTRKTSWTHVRDVLDICSSGKFTGQIHLPDGLEARRTRNAIAFVRHASPDWAHAKQEHNQDWQLILDGPGAYSVPHAGLSVTCTVEDNAAHFEYGQDALEAFLDLDCAPFPLVLRPWQPGDRFFPLGADGTQKVKKFLTDHKIYAQDRKNIYVLSSSKGIVWIVGHRVAETAKIQSKTNRILRCKVLLA